MKTSSSIYRSVRRPLVACCLFWSLGAVWLVLPIRISVNPDDVTFDGSRILVTVEETTGPFYRVTRGQEELRSVTVELERLSPSQPILRMLNPAAVELLGEDPAELATYWCLANTDWVLSGRVVGLSARWSTAVFSGVVPLFWVESYRPTGYFPNFLNRSDYFSIVVHITVLAFPFLWIVFVLARFIHRRASSTG